MTHTLSTRKFSDDEAQRQRMEALLSRHLSKLFNRLPRLAGFRLQSDLMVTDLSIFSWPNNTEIRGLDEIVTQSLVELAECHPEVIELLRDRTFARSLH